MSEAILPGAEIVQAIRLIRSHKVLLDEDLAPLYGVATKVLVQAVKRHQDRFPADFMFQLSAAEFQQLRSQTVASKRGGRRYPPYAFTEQGVAMLSSVLNSVQAIAVNIAIIRAFVKLRETLAAHQELAAKLNELEHKLEVHDEAIRDILEAIRQLMAPLDKPKRRIGFTQED